MALLTAPVSMPSPPSPGSVDAAAPTALGAFLRGVERRGLVFAWLLAGSRTSAESALAWTLDRFRREAGRTAFSEWPRHFWSLMLAAPTLRQPPPDPRWERGFEPLSRIGHGPRAALLLRLVAGLAESDAAIVLGITRPTYRLGLRRALPHAGDGGADVAAWEALGGAVQDMLRRLPVGPSTPPDADAVGAADRPARRPAGRGLKVALWLVALLTLLALAVTFRSVDRLPEGLAEAPDRILIEPLDAAEAPAGRYPAEAALALHPDLGLLLDAADPDPAAADPAFHAWLLAEVGPESGTAVDTGVDTGPGDSVPSRDHAVRAAQARLDALGPAARARLDGRREAWDALPHSERGELRERWQTWQALSPAERRRLSAAAVRHTQRSPDEQAALRARFDALDASIRRGWLLGPDLGADYPRLHPLIAQVPDDVRAPLLAALRGLDAQARDDLAVLAVRTPPQARAGLRVELLATPPEQRGPWLRRQVSPAQ